MTKDSAEYQALEISVAADKRYRRFLYLLAVSMFVLILCGLIALGLSIGHKIDALVEGSVARGNTRQEESKTIAKETERYNTCIFVIPLDQRTPANQQRCFEAADLPGGLSRGDFTPINVPTFTDDVANRVVVPAQPSSVFAHSESSLPQNTANSNPPQSNTSQSDEEQVEPQPGLVTQVIQGAGNLVESITKGVL